jgi:hypothetical protein
MTTQCTAVCLVRFYLIQCVVSVCANTRTHAHIDTKHDTVIETTSRWHILLQVYNRNEHCHKSRLSYEATSDFTTNFLSYRQKLLCILQQVSVTIFLHVFRCLHFELHWHKLRNTSNVPPQNFSYLCMAIMLYWMFSSFLARKLGMWRHPVIIIRQHETHIQLFTVSLYSDWQ